MFSHLASLAAARYLGAALFGLASLWWIAIQAGGGGGDGEVVVHIVPDDVELRIDGATFVADPDPSEPIVATLPPGWHTLGVYRDGRTLSQQDFQLEPGDSVVLTAFDQARPAPAPLARPGKR